MLILRIYGSLDIVTLLEYLQQPLGSLLFDGLSGVPSAQWSSGQNQPAEVLSKRIRRSEVDQWGRHSIEKNLG
jgi:hypothetical protein